MILQRAEPPVNDRPHALPVRPDSIPAELKCLPRWVPWTLQRRGKGKSAKVPVSVRTGHPIDATNPRNLVGFDDALGFYHAHHLDGIAYALRQADPFSGLDADRCRNPLTGEIDPLVLDLLADLDSYSEVSPSGAGVRAIAVGKIDPAGRNRAGGLELYGDGRMLTITGHRLPFAPPTIEPREDVLRRLQAKLGAKPRPIAERPVGGFRGTDEELICRAFAAKNGARVKALWAGRHDKPSHSEALLGLARQLAFWTGDDADRLERIITRSPLYAGSEAERSKWDSRRRGGSWGRVYVVQRGIELCPVFFGGGVGRTVRGAVREISFSPPIAEKTEGRDPSRRAQDCVSHGGHFGGLTAAWKQVLGGDVPAGLDAVRGRGERTRHRRRHLAALCWNLAKNSRTRHFYLAEEDAARLIGVDRRTIGRLLKVLRSRPVCLIRRVRVGNSFSGKASEYQWVGAAATSPALAEPSEHAAEPERAPVTTPVRAVTAAR